MNRRIALVIILILIASSLMIVKPAHSSIPKPFVPEFTVKFVNASYSVTTTNPYTGVNETQQISNNSIEVKIQNKPFDYSNNGLIYHIYFDIRIKPHFSDNWTEVYPLENLASSYNEDGTFSYAEYISPDSPTQSNSSYTIITFPVVPTELYQASGYDVQRYYSGVEGQESTYFAFLSAIPAGGQVDFQVEALVGHDSQMWVIEHPFYPTIGGHFASAVAYGETSGWSNTQTLTINAAAPTASPDGGTTSPTEGATSDDGLQQQMEQSAAVLGAVITAIAVTAALGLLLYFRKRSRKS
jgi:hypothetical protein